MRNVVKNPFKTKDNRIYETFLRKFELTMVIK